MARHRSDSPPYQCHIHTMKFHFKNPLARIMNAYSNRHEPESVRILAVYVWRATVVMSAAIILFGVVQAGIHLSSANATIAEMSNAEVQEPSLPLDRTALDALLLAFEARRVRFESLKTASSTVADPSR